VAKARRPEPPAGDHPEGLSSATASANFKPPPDHASPTFAHISRGASNVLVIQPELMEVPFSHDVMNRGSKAFACGLPKYMDLLGFFISKKVSKDELRDVVLVLCTLLHGRCTRYR
jgi:hypothetical protein